jgi:hypothetical protein
MIDDQTMLAKVMDPMGFTITVIGLSISFVGDGKFTKHRWVALLEGLMVVLVQLSVEVIESFWTLLQHHKIITGKGAHIRDLQGLI